MYSLFRSRTFYVIIAMFVVGGGNAIVPMLPASAQALVMLVLGGFASYFHLATGNSTTGSN